MNKTILEKEEEEELPLPDNRTFLKNIRVCPFDIGTEINQLNLAMHCPQPGADLLPKYIGNVWRYF